MNPLLKGVSVSFTHLHVHTEYSALDGLTRIAAGPKRAKALGQEAMAITDHGELTGAYAFHKACLEEGIKPIIGVEFYLAIGSRFEKNTELVPNDDDNVTDADDGKEKSKKYMHLTVLARNEQGWKNLLALHNKAEDSYWYKPRCLPAGEQIHTIGGVKNIEEIKVGDLVLTHKGRFRPVTQIMTNHHQGTLYGVNLNAGYNKTTWMTGEHPVLIREASGKVDWVEARDIIGGKQVPKSGLEHWNSFVCLPKVKGSERIASISPDDFIDAEWVRNGPKLTKTLHRKTMKPTFAHSFLPAAIDLDFDFGRFCGLYIAEGWVDRGYSVNFALHKDETEYASFVSSQLEALTGKPAVIDNHPGRAGYNGTTVRAYSSPLAQFMASAFGNGASNKAMPNFVFESNTEFMRGIYEGVLEGDGNTEGGSTRLRQTSENLAWQMRLLGAEASESFARVKEFIDPHPDHATSYRSNFSTAGVSHRKVMADNDYVYRPIAEVQTRDFDGLVYNFEVEEDHSYVSDFVVHNCDFDLIKQHGEGLTILTGCLGGPVAGPLARAGAAEKRGDAGTAETYRNEARKNLGILIDAVGRDHVFLEVMYHGIGAEVHAFREIRALSEETGIPLVATNDCHYEHQEDAHAHDAFLAVGVKKTLDDPNRFAFNGTPDYYIKSEEEMIAVLGNLKNEAAAAAWREACANTQLVVDQVADRTIPEGRQRLPDFPVPEGEGTAEEYLYKLVKAGAKERGNGRITKEVGTRLRTELDIINSMGFPSYFLITWDMIKWAESDYLPADWIAMQAGHPVDEATRERKEPILVGPGRGSAAGSYVSYALGIVDVDPLENHLLFERFLEPGRAGMPDIDVDFEQARRDEVFAYLQVRWGAGNVAHIGTVAFALSKAALKDAARVQKPSVPEAETQLRIDELHEAGNTAAAKKLTASAYRDLNVLASRYTRVANQLSALIPSVGGKALTLSEMMDESNVAGEAFRELADKENDISYDMIDLARQLEGVAKARSIHPCGFIISPEPLDGIVPMRHASHAEKADKTKPRVITWNGSECEEIGLLKNDVLGIMNLDIAHKAMNYIEQTTGEKLTLGSIPHPNTKGHETVDGAYRLMARGQTGGVFQMDGAGMRKVAQDIVPESLDDISAIVALFRPGPLSSKMDRTYAARKSGAEPISYSDFTRDPVETEAIDSVLGATYGMAIYQETIMRLSTVVAGFDAAQRSRLRKAMGKKKQSEMDACLAMWTEGAPKEFLNEDGTVLSPAFAPSTAQKLWDFIKGAAAYLFNASHSAAYGQLAYVTAFLKAGWPIEYGAAILAVADKDEKRLTALESLRHDGIVVDAPDVNLGAYETTVVDRRVVLGMSEIKGVGGAAKYIVAEREANGPFKDMADLHTRVRQPNGTGKLGPLPANTLTALIEAGALDSLPGTRLGKVMAARVAKANPEPAPYTWDPVQESTRQRLRTGVALGVHPLDSLSKTLDSWSWPINPNQRRRGVVEDEASGAKPSPISEIPEKDGSSVMTYGVVSMWAESAYSGGRRANFTLESQDSTINGVVWDRTLTSLRRSDSIPHVGDVVAVSGTVNVRMVTVGNEEDGDEESESVKELRVNEIELITQPEAGAKRTEVSQHTGFTLLYTKLRQAPEPTPPAGPRGGGAPRTASNPKPASAASEADDELAPVVSLANKRKVKPATGTLVAGLTTNASWMDEMKVAEGSLELHQRFSNLPTPEGFTGAEKGAVYRGISKDGSVVVLVADADESVDVDWAKAGLEQDSLWTKVQLPRNSSSSSAVLAWSRRTGIPTSEQSLSNVLAHAR